MRTVTLSILLATSAVLGGAASAQQAPAYVPTAPFTSSQQQREQWNPDTQWDSRRGDPGAFMARGDSLEVGVAALKADEFVLAEDLLGDALRKKPSNADTNFYMGVAKMNLGKWEEAKTYLEIAAAKKSGHPDPKSRLGVTYAKLGDINAANAQRADLMRMADACKTTCRLSAYINGGIEMIDEALAEPAESGRG